MTPKDALAGIIAVRPSSVLSGGLGATHGLGDVVESRFTLALPGAAQVTDAKVEEPKGFNYTSPSVLEGSKKKLSAPQKRKYGCTERGFTPRELREIGCAEETYTTKKGNRSKRFTGRLTDGRLDQRCKMQRRFTGNRCTGTQVRNDETGQPSCENGLAYKDPRCSASVGKPCVGNRFKAPGKDDSCPVQSVWVDGTPALRLCTGHEKPGRLYAVKDAADAIAFSREACEFWKRKGTFKGFRPKGKRKNLGLGRAKKAKKR